MFLTFPCQYATFFNPFKFFKILILDRSISTDRLSGIDLIKFSINPPPVICAAECI